jgi:uncharacterized protein YbjQ (UPF0145 family)
MTEEPIGGGQQSESPVLVATTNEVEGRRTEKVIGEVFGVTVRSRNLGSVIGAAVKSLFGGELRGMTKILVSGRSQALERMTQEATARGANAVIAMRFDVSELGNTWTEICAYGTAVVLAAN